MRDWITGGKCSVARVGSTGGTISEQSTPLPLSMTRIGVGVLWLAVLTITAPNWHRFYGFDGMLSLDDSDLNKLRRLSTTSLMYLTDSVLPISFWWWIGLVLSICVTIGFQSRLATIGLFVFTSSLIQRNSSVVNGEELVTRMLLFYGCFSHWGDRLSLDAWILKRKLATDANGFAKNTCRPQPLVWYWRMMQINFLLIYAISLPNKFAQDIDWLTGDALHWTITSDM